jgi:dihydrolipoamide dehydrogenase
MPDLVVVGGGPAGVAAALRARRMGADVVVFEKGGLGGTCVHAGCIPSAAYHTSAGFLHDLRRAGSHGVDVTAGRLDWDRMQAWASQVTDTVAGALTAQLRYAGVPVENRTVAVSSSGVDGYAGTPVVVATGARSVAPDDAISNDAVMGLPRPPGSLLVLGAGRFSLEWGDLLCTAGSRVTVVAAEGELLPGEDAELVEFVCGVLEDRGVRFVADRPDEPTDVVLAADTREPTVPGMTVDELCRTGHDGVWAAGDVTGPRWLSNRARAQGEAAAANALGESVRVREERLPRGVNTDPELAAVGLSEADAAARGLEVTVGVAELGANARALTVGRPAGALKLVVDPEFGEILGAHMVGMGAREVIGQVALAMTLEADYRDLLRVAHVHPSLAELITEAAAAI